MKEKKPEKKEIYTADDLISRGTYISTMDVFWNHLYKIFPELTNNQVIVKTTYKKSTEEEKNDFLERLLNNERNLFFKTNSLKEEGFIKAEHEMLCDKVLVSMFGNEPFGVVEIKNRDEWVVDLEWIYYQYEL